VPVDVPAAGAVLDGGVVPVPVGGVVPGGGVVPLGGVRPLGGAAHPPGPPAGSCASAVTL
jgi:hypothetical protein